MWRILFFFMGLPVLIVSFFEAVETLPLASDYEVLIDGNVIELDENQKGELVTKVENLFAHSATMPAFCVVTPEEFESQTQSGIFVTIKFDDVIQIEDLPFDKLVFGVQKGVSGFNIMRGMKGVVQGRCIYLSSEENCMDELYDFLESLGGEKIENIEEVQSDISNEDSNDILSDEKNVSEQEENLIENAA